MPSVQQRTLNLSTPVEFAGTIYKQLVFQKLKAKHLLGIQKESTDPIEQSYFLAAASAGVDVGVIYELDLEDVVKMQDIINGFFPPEMLANKQAMRAA